MIHAQLVEAHVDIERYREDPANSENQYTHFDRNFEGTCTYPSPLFPCPRRPNAKISRALKATYGANMAIVGLPQLHNWIKQWNDHYVPQDHFKMTLILGHAKYASRYSLKSSYKADLKGVRRRDKPEDASDRAIRPFENKYVYKPSKKAHKYLIISTPDSVESQCDNSVTENHFYTKPGKGKKPVATSVSQPLPSMIVALIGIDESHRYKSPFINPWTYIKKLAERMIDVGIPKTMGMTGTPLTIGPENLEAIVGCLTDPRRDQSLKNPRTLTVDDIKECAEQFEECTTAITKGKSAYKNKLNQIMTKLGLGLTDLILRQTKNSQWFDQPILTLPPCTLKPINVKFPSQYRTLYDNIKKSFRKRLEDELSTAQSKWDESNASTTKPSSTRPEAVRVSTVTSLSRQLRIAASIPWVLEYWTAEGHDIRFKLEDFTSEWILPNGRLVGKCIFQECVKQGRNFPKFIALDRILKKIKEGREKLIIISEYLAVAIAVNEVRMQCLLLPFTKSIGCC